MSIPSLYQVLPSEYSEYYNRPLTKSERATLSKEEQKAILDAQKAQNMYHAQQTVTFSLLDEKNQKPAEKIESFFTDTLPEVVSGTADVIGDVYNEAMGAVKTVVGDVSDVAGTAASGMANVVDEARPQFVKKIMWGGALVIGAMILWSFVNPKETTQLITTGVNTVAKAAPLV